MIRKNVLLVLLPTLFQSLLLVAYDVDNQLTVGLEARARYEVKDGAGGFGNALDFVGRGADQTNAYYYLRTTLSADWKPQTGLRTHLALRDNAVWGDDRTQSPYEDSWDLFEAYVEFTPNGGQSPWTFKLGRQELAYGSQLLIGRPNRYTSRSWDGIRAIYKADDYQLDGFVARPVVKADGQFNRSNSNEIVSGLYASSAHLLENWKTDGYLFARHSSADAGHRQLYALGSRLYSKPGAFGAWGFTGEWVIQRGSFGANKTDLESYLIHLGTTYQCDASFWNSRLGLHYYYSPGDRDPSDGKSETFQLFFPGKNHPRAGRNDIVGWRNMHALGLTLDARPDAIKGLKLHAGAHAFWMADTRDFLYGQGGKGRSAQGFGRNANYDAYVGSELACEGRYKINQHLSCALEYVHFFSGAYLDQSVSSGSAPDIQHVFATLTFKY